MERLKKLLAHGGWVYPFIILMFMGFPAFLVLGALGETLGEPHRQTLTNAGFFFGTQSYFLIPVAIVGLVNRVHWRRDGCPWEHRKLALLVATLLWVLSNVGIWSLPGTDSPIFWGIVYSTLITLNCFALIMTVAYCGRYEEV